MKTSLFALVFVGSLSGCSSLGNLTMPSIALRETLHNSMISHMKLTLKHAEEIKALSENSSK